MKKILLLMAIALPFVLISCSDDKDEPMPLDNHEFVDLGLPSGTLWATCNIGANNPEEYGDYFAWGEAHTKDTYDWNTYKLGGYDRIGNFYLMKYCTNSNFGPFDDKTELDSEDDAAYANWGPLWRMPSYDQIEELYNYCTWQWTQRNGVNGQLGTGPNGASLFLPVAGYYWEGVLNKAGSGGYYWSRTLSQALCEGSYFLGFDSEHKYDWHINGRAFGHTVRAVRAPKK